MNPHALSSKPPRLARALVAVVTPNDDRPFVLADLDEESVLLRERSGRWAAYSWYWQQALSAVGPGIRRRFARHPKPADDDGPRRSRWRSNFGADLSYAARRLRQAPMLLLVTVTSLGLGIGATTTVFSVADGLLFKVSNAIVDPDGVLSIYTVPKSDPVFGQTSFPDFATLENEVTSLDAVAAMRPGAVEFGDGERTQPVMVESVTVDFFKILGARPALGRLFVAAETQPGQAEHVTVVSYDFWQRELGGGADVLGRQIRLDGKLFTIIGVGPEGLKGRLAEMRIAAWVPVGLPGGFYHATDEEVRDRADREYGVLARATPGYSVEQVEAELSLLADRLHREYGEQWEEGPGQPLVFRVVAANSGMLPPEFMMALTAAAALVLAAAGLILLIACSNVAGLLLAQAHERRQEMAVRAALGAGRWRLVRMLLTESSILALAGCALGVLIARVAITSIGSVALPVGVPLEFDFGLNGRVLLFALTVAAVACLVFGLLPALAGSRSDLIPALKMGRRSPGGGGSLRLRRLLVVGQVAASLVLLVGAGLVLRSTSNLLDADLGFERDRIAVVSKDLSFGDHSESDAMVIFEDIAARVRSHPEVQSVALATGVERVFDDLLMAEISPQGYETTDDDPLLVRMNAVDPEYLSMLQIDLAQGRALSESDQRGSERVALVNQAFAARYWPERPVIGQTIRILGTQGLGAPVRDLNDSLTVVGLVRDPAGSRTSSAGREFGGPAFVTVNPKMWVPLAQHPSTRVVIHAQARGTAESIVPVLRTETVTSEVPMIAPQSLEALISFPLAIPRAIGSAMRWGGVFALVLAFLGIYGIVSFTVTERSHEMAIRKAIGARSDQVVGRVMRHGLTLALWGITLGLLVAVPMAVGLRSELEAVRPWDPVAVAGGVGIILLAALLASGLPARRLSALDPMTVLRDE